MTYSREKLRRDGLDSVTITPASAGYGAADVQWEVYAHGEYDDSSVLAGQYRRVCLAVYQSLQEARAAYPWAEVEGGLLPASWLTQGPPSTPPAWFDRDDAGEAWGENDY